MDVQMYVKNLQFIGTEGRFWHPVTNTKLIDQIISTHPWIWISP